MKYIIRAHVPGVALAEVLINHRLAQSAHLGSPHHHLESGACMAPFKTHVRKPR